MKLQNANLVPFYKARHSNLNPGSLIELEIQASSKEEAEKFVELLGTKSSYKTWIRLYGNQPTNIYDNIIIITVPLDYIEGGLDRAKNFYFTILSQGKTWERVYY